MMVERFQDIIKFNRVLSWLLTEITAVMLASGYAMTFIGVDIPILRVIHFLFDFLFTLAFTAHMIINTFILRFRWKPIISSVISGKAQLTTKLRLLQRLSSFGLLIAGVLQVISGLDWFKLGLSRLLPYPLHREIDLALLFFLIIHLTLAAYFALLRRRVREKEGQVKSIDIERREAIALMGGALLAFFAAIILDKSPKVGTDITGTQGTLQPGQTEIERLKVLHIGKIPPWDPETWRFEVSGNVDNPLSLSWEAFRALPSVIRSADFHCVTGWTKFDNKWEGVSFEYIKELAQLRPNARYATIECLRGYTTSLPVSELSQDDVLLAYRLDDKELPREYGGPLRLVVPQKYGYKSAKWVIKVKFTEFQELGYWEKRGYSNTADPYTNDRYSSNPRNGLLK
jgi:DMSO/TMAO reductase YedYZ molybdopterin-dependent catalytic subunit